MPTTETNVPYRRVIEYRYVAEWRSIDVRPNHSRAARPFGPNFELRDDELAPERGYTSPKEVMYLPVKRDHGEEKVPSVGLFISIHEAEGRRNVTVNAHRGARVKIRVFNVFRGQRSKPVELEGALDDAGICFVEIPASTVADWLKPQGPFAGRINEILLDFSFECPSLQVNGRIWKGQSINRLFLYRRKVIVFLPGVFGSQILLKLPDGRQVGFPDKYAEPTSFLDYLFDANPATEIARQLYTFLNHELGALECDATGQPLIKSINPVIFNLFGIVYDVFDRCREARMRYFPGVPKEFHLIEMRVFAYDWRCDLTDAAQALARRLVDLQTQLRKLPDTDDEVALAGHSTGGVIIRRALKEAGMQSLVSHALFVNVPFRGAPKALGVLLTGKDPPGGGPANRMVPFVAPESLRAVAMSMPIVYHLAPSEKYPARVAYTPERPASAGLSAEDDKRSLVRTAIACGFLAPPRFVKPTGLSEGERALLASNADTWHRYWGEAFERFRAQDIYDAVYPAGYATRDEWFTEELNARGLQTQFSSRFVGSWNEELAARARKFHQESEELAASGAWAKKVYIFRSIHEGKPTTGSIYLEDVQEVHFPTPLALLTSEGVPLIDFYSGASIPARDEETLKLPGISDTTPAPFVHQWVRHERACQVVKWRLHAEHASQSGDGTVPTQSLLGFGGPATVIRAIEGGPAHIDAPGQAYVWDRIVEILQGTIHGGPHIDGTASTQ